MVEDHNSTVPGASQGPERCLSGLDATVMVVGLVLGVGIFRAPQVVAANSSSGPVFLGLWVAGGLVSLVGALCYAELASTYPSRGGEYHFVSRALGRGVGFLLAWSRMMVLQTGSIAILAYVFADYATPLLGLDVRATPGLAAAVVVSLTAVNLLGLRSGRLAQYLLTALEVTGLLVVIGAILLLDRTTAAGAQPSPASAQGGANLGLAMVFVLLTFGGWSEAAYLSAELRDRRTVGRALLGGLAIITTLYLLANVAYLGALGLAGVARSPMVAGDLLARVVGPGGSLLVSVIVMVATLSSANAAMITGARGNFALGRDVRWLTFLTVWARGGSPTNALLVQGAIALVLVVFGGVARSGFEAMVAYTAPVFWLMLLLCGLSLYRLRRRDPERHRPFSVPGYPVTPALFCATSAFMLYSSVAHAGAGALLGLAVMAMGIPLFVLGRRREVPAGVNGASAAAGRRPPPA